MGAFCGCWMVVHRHGIHLNPFVEEVGAVWFRRNYIFSALSAHLFQSLSNLAVEFVCIHKLSTISTTTIYPIYIFLSILFPTVKELSKMLWRTMKALTYDLHQLILQEERVTRLLNEWHTVDLVYLDFAKTFYSVNYRFLLAKLKSSDIDGAVLNLIKSYLSNLS